MGGMRAREQRSENEKETYFAIACIFQTAVVVFDADCIHIANLILLS